MHNCPLTHPGRAIQIVRALLTRSCPTNNEPGTATDSDKKGNLLIRYMWAKGIYCILNIQVVNTDADSYVQKTTEKMLHTAEREKNVST